MSHIDDHEKIIDTINEGIRVGFSKGAHLNGLPQHILAALRANSITVIALPESSRPWATKRAYEAGSYLAIPLNASEVGLGDDETLTALPITQARLLAAALLAAADAAERAE